jgi:hypothetical protein
MCYIKTKATFIGKDDPKYTLVSVNPMKTSIRDWIRVGNLGSTTYMQQTDIVEPDSTIYHMYVVDIMGESTQYTLTETITLKGCHPTSTKARGIDFSSYVVNTPDEVKFTHELIH